MRTLLKKITLKGSTLVIVMVSTTVLIILLGALVSMTGLMQQQIRRETQQTQALLLAEGGINHGLAQLRLNGAYTGETYTMTTGTVETYIKTTTGVTTLDVRSFVPSKTATGRRCKDLRVIIDPVLKTIIAKTYQEIIETTC